MQNKDKQKNWSRRALMLAGLAGATVTLTGCPVLFVGGIGAGVMSAVDRRSSGAQIDDQTIELRAKQDLSSMLGADKAHINVTSFNRQVLLTGEVGSSDDKIVAEETVRRVANVRSVVNALAVGPVTSLRVRTDDSVLTGKVKTALANVENLSSGHIKVVTERSVVYLMGLVTMREAQLASEKAATVVGVQKVVRVFEIISEEDLMKIDAQSSPTENIGEPTEVRP